MTAASAPAMTHSAPSTAQATGVRAAAGVLLRHRSLFSATFGLVLFTAFIITISIAPAYRSESTLMLRNPAPGALASLQSILHSREVAESLVDPDWLKTPLAQHSGAEIRRHERAVAAFGRQLQVTPGAAPGTVSVAFVAPSSTQAADTLGQLIEESGTRLKLTEPAPTPRTAPPPDAPAAVSLAANNPADAETLRSRIAELDTARRSTEAQWADTEQRVAAQKHDLAILSPWILGDVNPAYRQGKEKLAASIAQLGALRSRVAGLGAQREQLARQLTELRTAAPTPAPAPAASAFIPPPPAAQELVVTERPTLPTRPIRPRPLMNFVLGIVAACLLGLGAVVFAEVRRPAVSVPDRVEEVAALPLLATIAHAAPRVQGTYGALALSPVFREESEPEAELSTGLFSVAPARLPLVAPIPELRPVSRLVLEPLEPAPRLPARGLGNAPLPARSRLTPSQRAQLRRSAPAPDPEGRGYVTYTFEGRR